MGDVGDHQPRKGDRRYPGVYYNDDRARWEQRLTIDGKRHLVSAKTPAEVARKAADARDRATRGMLPTNNTMTTKTFLEWWLDEVVPRDTKQSTAITYRHIIKGYVLPTIGTRPLVKLAPADVTKMLHALEARGLAPNTQRAARSVLRRALRRAQVEGLVTRNVAALADGVRVPTPEGRTMTIEQARAFLAHVETDRLGAAYAVMLALGLRRGELLGLTWPDVDLDSARPVLRVTRTLQRLPDGLTLSEPKTKGSRRVLDLPAAVVEALRAHDARQAEEQEHAGPEWVALPLGVDLVFRTEFGTAVDPANFKHRTHRLTKAAGIGVWGPHELRHSAASILLAMGLPLKTVSETLGHSSIRVTADVYSHLLAPARQEAATAAQEALWG